MQTERPIQRIIVGAAIVQNGRVLACARADPPEVAGRWEFPGGKVEAGETESEALITSGPFRTVRNPVYLTLLGSCIARSLVLATALTPASLAVCVGALELQTRAVEEPALLAAHRDAFLRYAARTGRFLPGLGRLRSSPPPGSRC